MAPAAFKCGRNALLTTASGLAESHAECFVVQVPNHIIQKTILKDVQRSIRCLTGHRFLLSRAEDGRS